MILNSQIAGYTSDVLDWFSLANSEMFTEESNQRDHAYSALIYSSMNWVFFVSTCFSFVILFLRPLSQQMQCIYY